jgi:protein-tyrosine-phosphatase
MMNPKPLSILFLSTGNAARSILAEALMRQMAGSRYHPRSAGFKPLPEVHPATLNLLREKNVPIDLLHTKGWGEFMITSFMHKTDVIVTLSEEARLTCPAWPENPVRVHWTVDDPLSASKDDVREWKFKKCFATLETRIATLIKNRVAKCSEELLLQLKDVSMAV